MCVYSASYIRYLTVLQSFQPPQPHQSDIKDKLAYSNILTILKSRTATSSASR